MSWMPGIRSSKTSDQPGSEVVKQPAVANVSHFKIVGYQKLNGYGLKSAQTQKR